MTNDLGRRMNEAAEGVSASSDAFQKTLSRADRLKRRRRASTILVTFSIFAVAVTFLWRGFRPGDVDRPASDGSGEPPAGTVFSPPVHPGPDGLVMPLAFADGTKVELTFPSDIGLDELSLRASINGRIHDEEGTERTMEAYPRPPEAIPVLSDTVIKTFAGAGGGEVALVEGHPQAGAHLYLVFRFGMWTVLVYDTPDNGMSDEQRAIWAQALDGRTDEDGFLLLDAKEPLTLQRSGFPFGPQLLLVGPNHVPEVTIYPTTCNPEPAGEVEVSLLGEDGWHASWCPADGVAIVQATGERDFVLELVKELNVKPL